MFGLFSNTLNEKHKEMLNQLINDYSREEILSLLGVDPDDAEKHLDVELEVRRRLEEARKSSRRKAA
jgi:hypothetical protein